MYTFISQTGSIIQPHLNHVLSSFYYSTNLSAYAITTDGQIFAEAYDDKNNLNYSGILTNYFDKNTFDLPDSFESEDAMVIEMSENICFILFPVYIENQLSFYIVSEPFALVRICELSHLNPIAVHKLKIIEKERLPYIGQLFFHLSSKAIYAGRHHFVPTKKMTDTKWAVDLGMDAIESNNSIINIASIEKIGDLILNDQLEMAKSTLTSMQSILSYPKINSCPMMVTKYQSFGLIITLQNFLSKQLPNLRVDLQQQANILVENIEKYRSMSQLIQYGFDILDAFHTITVGQHKMVLPPNIKEAIDYIHRYYFKNIKLEDIANSIPMNKTYLSTQFKQYVGKSYKEYLNEYRINQSLILLKDQQYTLTEIATRVGFESANYFSTVFKKSKGISPSRYGQS